MRNFLENEDGQVVLEYVLGLVMVLGLITIIATTFRKSLFRLWESLAREIAAPCPGCPPPPGAVVR